MLLNMADATNALRSLAPNTIREAATHLWDAAGADWDGTNVSLLRDGEWTKLHEDMNRGLEQCIRTGCYPPNPNA